jgi:hypothetical protein
MTASELFAAFVHGDAPLSIDVDWSDVAVRSASVSIDGGTPVPFAELQLSFEVDTDEPAVS